jgi:allantoate deiminase
MAVDNLTRLLGSMLDELAGITDEPGKITRTFLSAATEPALKLVGSYMQDFGLEPRVGPAGNLIGRLKSQNPGPKTKTLLLGSHLDTVRDAGKFDGPLGVLLPLVALHELGRRGVKLPYHVEVIGFSEEEGVRFASAYLGSKAYTGKLREADLALRDSAGVTVREAIESFSGKFTLPRPAHARKDLLGYVEVHIEQGPVLEQENLAVGVVSAIAGQSRFKLTWTGKAGHAGTTPMGLRRDALAGAAEFALAAEQLARRTAGLVATVGAVAVAPGAANVIPGQVVHTLDVRHAKDAVRKAALRKLGRLAAQIARRRGLKVSWQRTQDNGATPCSPELTARLARSVKAVQGRSLALVSGAGHDGVVMASLTPIAMLFVRCRGGLSHHPDEYAAPRDLRVALEVMIDFLQRLAAENRT